MQMLLWHVEPLVSIGEACRKCQYILRSWFWYCSWNAPNTFFPFGSHSNLGVPQCFWVRCEESKGTSLVGNCIGRICQR